SSNPAIATVSTSGLVTGGAAGSATISAASGGKTGTAAITVTASAPTVASVTVTPASTSLMVGGKVQLAVVAKDANGNALSGQTFSWSSSNPAIATVSASGLVTGGAAGSATI